MVEENIEEQEKKGFFSWLKSKFSSKEEEGEEKEDPVYKRRLLDGRIEKYLDQNFDSYIQEYSMVTGLDLESFEVRYTELTQKITSMNEYMLQADADIGALENDINAVKEAKKKSK